MMCFDSCGSSLASKLCKILYKIVIRTVFIIKEFLLDPWLCPDSAGNNPAATVSSGFFPERPLEDQ